MDKKSDYTLDGTKVGTAYLRIVEVDAAGVAHYRLIIANVVKKLPTPRTLPAKDREGEGH